MRRTDIAPKKKTEEPKALSSVQQMRAKFLALEPIDLSGKKGDALLPFPEDVLNGTLDNG